MTRTGDSHRVRHCETMVEVRAHIDALDARIVPLVAARSPYVAQAGRIKQSADEVHDQPRINAIIARVRKLAIEHGAPPDIVEATWRAMIAASMEFEHAEFARLHDQDKP
ncbi:MAG: chorismate mutase [Ottowia sp.]|nr:chorismate mutase [Ottowia sp.]